MLGKEQLVTAHEIPGKNRVPHWATVLHCAMVWDLRIRKDW